MRADDREGGWGIVEIVASLALLVLGVLSLAAGFQGAEKLAASTRDNYLLNLAHRNMVAELKGAQFENLTNEYGTGSGRESFLLDTIDSTGEVLGEVVYSTTQVDPSRPSGSITLHDVESSLPADWSISGLDMNGDGSVSGTTCIDYEILPVEIDITLTGLDGTRTLDSDLILAKPAS